MLIVFALLALPVAFVLLEWGADNFTEGVAALGTRTGISPTVLGLLTAGGEWEEIAVVAIAAATGRTEIAIGNVIGACVANILGSFSLGVLAAPVSPRRDDRRFALALLAVTVAVCAPLAATGTVNRAGGGALLFLFAAYLAVLVVLVVRGRAQITLGESDDDDDHDTDNDHDATPLSRLIVRTAAGLLAIIAGAEILVEAAVRVAGRLGVPEIVVGLTVVAIGTTLPDKIISIVGARRGQSSLVIANTVGSNFCNLLAALGIAALVRPLTLDRPTRAFDLPVLVGATALLTLLLTRRSVGQWAGAGLLTLYIAYLVGSTLLHRR